MSSGSDPDEFYDAADGTPTESFLHTSGVGSPSSLGQFSVSEIEEEERRLLQLRRRKEERRRKEDEELERRLIQLKQKRIQADYLKEHEDDSQEIEERRKKLEEMRHTLGHGTEQSSFFSTSHDSSIENDSPNVSRDVPNIFALSSLHTSSINTPKSHTIEKMENNGTSAPSYKQHAKKKSGSWGDLPKNDSEVTRDSIGSEIVRRIEQISLQDIVAGARSDSSSPRIGKKADGDLHAERSVKEKDRPTKSLTVLLNGRKVDSSQESTHVVVDSILQQTQVKEDSEPDIVKSTKSHKGTPPNSLQTPIPPPRRKRGRHTSLSATSPSEELPAPPTPQFYRREPPSPKLGGSSLDNSLNVRSALEGSRLILTENADDCLSNTNTSNDNRLPDYSKYSSASAAAPISYSLRPSSSYEQELSQQLQTWQSLSEGAREASPNRRPRSSSGRLLSDEEILELVTVRNLDTGEMIPLSTAEDKLPKCVNPLALHIMRRTKEFSSDTSLNLEGLSDESDSRSEKSVASSSNTVRRKGVKFKKLFGRTVKQMKNVADQALHTEQAPVEEEVSVNGKVFKIKSSSRNKGPYDFSQPNILQEMSGDHTGAIWTMKFSPCGKLLATGGQDSILRVWVLKSTYSYFEDFRQKYSDVRLSPAVSHESLHSTSSEASAMNMDPLRELNPQEEEEEQQAPFRRQPFCVYKGHTADLLDLSWSKNYFILSSSMDKTVRLWHISRRECLCTFQHIDFVTAIVFHPKDDRYFLSGSLDGKLRLWNIPDKKVTMWNELSGSSTLITTANFCYNGRLAVVGTYDGKCIFYTTEQLKYYTMVNVRSTRGKNSKGRKITGIESMPGEEKILVTSNDSRIRLYNLRDLTLSCKYKGCMNNSSQIRASFSPTGKYVICGSEDFFLYVWKTNHEFLKFTSARRDRNDYWEAIKVHNAVVTSAIFAPNPSFIFRMAQQESLDLKVGQFLPEDDTEEREIIVSADFTGAIKVITNRPNRTF